MDEWRTICCAVDFSEPSRFALQRAARLARRVDAQLVVAHVVEPERVRALATQPELVEAELTHRKALLEAWRVEAEEVRGAPVVARELHGDPVLELLRFAEAQPVDLLVIGTHGHSGLGAVVFGSIANKVVRLAPCPVLSVRPPPPA